MHALLLTSYILAPYVQEPPPVRAPSESPELAASQQPAWALDLSAYFVDPPGEEAYTTTILAADRGPLHLEARYNYEDLDTASVFGGWTFEVGDELHAALTPMLGVVFGETDGVAPALLVDANWRKLAFYTEAEYVLDRDDSEFNYFYSWSTLMWWFTDAFAAGVVSERTKIVETHRNLQVGLGLEFAPGPIQLSLYWYNPGQDLDYYTLSVGLSL